MTAFNVPGFPTIFDKISDDIEVHIKKQWRNLFSQIITPKMKSYGWNFVTDFFEQDGYPKTFLHFSFVYKNEENYTTMVRGNALETFLYVSCRDVIGNVIGGGDTWLREPLVVPYHANTKVLKHKDQSRDKTTYFVSGHLDLTPQEFMEHYRRPIVNAIDRGANFVVGDAAGADIMAQRFFLSCGIPDVTVYHMLEEPRNNVGFQTRGGFKSDQDRDSALTAASSQDIAWIRPGREDSGTAKNLARRQSS